MNRRMLLVDVTQFVKQPAATGVQRVLAVLLDALATGTFEAWAGYHHNGHYSLIAPRSAADIIRRGFEVGWPTHNPGLAVWNAFELGKDAVVPADKVGLLFDLYLLPEPTFLTEVLEIARWLKQDGIPVAALVYDALPALRPELFSRRHQLTTDAYFQLIAELDHVAAISETTLGQIESRLRCTPIPNRALIAPPVTRPVISGVEQPAIDPNSIVHVGTLEPRKQIRTLLDAIERVRAEGTEMRLTLLGRFGWDDRSLLERIEELDRRGWVSWVSDATDSHIDSAIRSAAALVYISENEGFGLPPLEALALGTPVIVHDGLPSLDTLPATGQIRLTDVSVDSVAQAFRTVADTSANAMLRLEAQALELPTLKEFRSSLFSWLLAGGADDPPPSAG